MKRNIKAKIAMVVSLSAGVTFAYFMWLTWSKLTLWIGDSNVVWGITGGLVLLFIFFGTFGINKIVKKFT